MDGNSPWGGQGTPISPSGAQPPLPTNPGLPPPPAHVSGANGRGGGRGLIVGAGVVAAILLGVVALVVAIVNGKSTGSSVSTQTQVTQPEPAQGLDDAADRALCLAIGPLMVESQDQRNVLQRSGAPNTPERKAAIPKFVSDVYDWVPRAQIVLNDHAQPPRYLARTFQRYIDDTLTFAESLAPDRHSSVYENSIYDLGMMDLAGLLGRCFELDAPWWN